MHGCKKKAINAKKNKTQTQPLVVLSSAMFTDTPRMRPQESCAKSRHE